MLTDLWWSLGCCWGCPCGLKPGYVFGVAPRTLEVFGTKLGCNNSLINNTTISSILVYWVAAFN